MICRKVGRFLSDVGRSGSVSVLTNTEIEAGAKAIAEDMRLPGGGLKKLARVVQAHLEWFDAVEARGMTWPDIARALFAVGVIDNNGHAFSVGRLSSAVWHKRHETERRARPRNSQQGADQNVPARRHPAGVALTSQSQSQARQRGPRRVPGPATLVSTSTKKALRPEPHEMQRRTKGVDPNPAPLSKASIPKAGSSRSERNSLTDARTSMKRAAAIRRKAD
jgi:hypothetical protein